MEPTRPEARAALAPTELAPSMVATKSIRPKAAKNFPLALLLALTASVVVAALAFAMWGPQ
jgi:hypothetical protein